MKKFIIQEREAGNRIEEVNTIEEAKKILNQYEEEDKKEGTYTENFYEIIEENKMDINTMSIAQLEEYKKDLENKNSELYNQIGYKCNNTTEELISAEDINEVETIDSIREDILQELEEVENELQIRYKELV